MFGKNKITAIVFLLIVNCVLLIGNCYSQFTWSRVFGGDRNDAAYNCFQLRDGNYLMIGENMVVNRFNQPVIQTYLVKLNPLGSIIWDKTYGDSLYGNFAYSAVEDPDGNIFIASNWNEPKLIKTDSFGNIIWMKGLNNNVIEFGGLELIDQNNRLLISGVSEKGFKNTKSLTKVDTSGNEIWTKSYTDTSEYSGFFNAFYFDTNAYYLVGRRIDIPGFRGSILKIDTNGVLVWEKLLHNFNSLFSIEKNSNHSYLAVGSRDGGLYCIKFNQCGKTEWERIYGSDSITAGLAIVMKESNSFVIAGGGNDAKGKMLFIDSLGNVSLYITHPNAPRDNIFYYSINNCIDEGFIISGIFEFNDNGSNDALVVKTNEYGNTIPIGIILSNEIAYEHLLRIKAYPNPFNTQSIVEFKLSKDSDVKMTLYNTLGQNVAVLISSNLKKGTHRIAINTGKLSLSSGIYFLITEAVSGKIQISESIKLSHVK